MRLSYLDNLRGFAVVLMVIFHASWDLRTFGYVNWDFSQGFWYAFPRFIAFTFLFCVGLSLHYGHYPKVRWNALKKRTLKLGLCALTISLVTYFIFPTQWIFFGTLHCILAGSLLGALVVPHRKIAFLLLILILLGQYTLGFDIKWVSGIVMRPSMDFIPIYPWFWSILAGILLAPYLVKFSFLRETRPNKFLNFLGTHSLKIYLLHQPILFGLLWLFSLVKR